MSTAQEPAPRRDGVAVGATVLRRLTGSYLLQFLVFAAALGLVVVLLARAPEDCECGRRTAQVVLLALAGLLSAVGTVLLAGGAGPSYAPSRAGDGGPAGAGKVVAGAVLVGLGVLLLSVAGLVSLW